MQYGAGDNESRGGGAGRQAKAGERVGWLGRLTWARVVRTIFQVGELASTNEGSSRVFVQFLRDGGGAIMRSRSIAIVAQRWQHQQQVVAHAET